ncbi:MAG TPA: HEPN domain-containing protein [Syntrophaceae bacterium]|nr:HEPN domain-containing protein [Syntrophaceae bacterium]
MATGESVESLIRCVDEARYPQSYFLYYNLKREREVYSMDVEGLKRKEAQNYLKLASEYLDGSRANCQKGYFRIAVDAAYNACELIVKGLLRLPDIPSSRGGLSTSLENYL